jgi:hypothetical protein
VRLSVSIKPPRATRDVDDDNSMRPKSDGWVYRNILRDSAIDQSYLAPLRIDFNRWKH